jgi:hypothetical protein
MIKCFLNSQSTLVPTLHMHSFKHSPLILAIPVSLHHWSCLTGTFTICNSFQQVFTQGKLSRFEYIISASCVVITYSNTEGILKGENVLILKV